MRRRWPWLVLLLFVLVTAFFTGVQGRRMLAVVAVQDALDRDWETNFNEGGRPRLMPPVLDEFALDQIYRVIPRDPKFAYFAKKQNREEVWIDRIRSLFRGKITNIDIYQPGPLRDDLGAALRRFPSLKRLSIQDPQFNPDAWGIVFAGLQHLDKLEELEIGGDELNDTALEHLANQPSLRKITITRGYVSEYCALTFKTLPHLNELNFEASAIVGGTSVNDLSEPVARTLIREALPRVNVTFR